MKKMFLLFTFTFFSLNTVAICSAADASALTDDSSTVTDAENANGALVDALPATIQFQNEHQQTINDQKPVADTSLDETIKTTQNNLEAACKDSTNRETYSKELPAEITSKDINKQRIRNSIRRLFNVKEEYTIKFHTDNGYTSKATVVFDKTKDGECSPKIRILTYQKTFALLPKGRLLHSAEAMLTEQSIQNGKQNSFKYTPISETSYNHGHLESITHYQDDKIRTIKYNQMGRISEDKTYAKIKEQTEDQKYYLTRHLTHEYARDDQRAISSTKIHNPENNSNKGEQTIIPTYETGIISDNVRIGHSIETIIKEKTITNYHKLNGEIYKTSITKGNENSIFDKKKRIIEHTDTKKNIKTKFKYGFFTGKLKSVEISSTKKDNNKTTILKVELSKTIKGDNIHHLIDPKSGRIIQSISKDGKTTLTHEYDDKGKHTSSSSPSSSGSAVTIDKRWYRTTKADVKATVKKHLSTLTSS